MEFSFLCTRTHWVSKQHCSIVNGSYFYRRRKIDLATCSFLLFVYDKWSPFSYLNHAYDMRHDTRIFTLKEGIWYCLMALVPQGGGDTPRNPSGKLLCATWWIFGFVVHAPKPTPLFFFSLIACAFCSSQLRDGCFVHHEHICLLHNTQSEQRRQIIGQSVATK